MFMRLPLVLFALGITYGLSGPALALWRRDRQRHRSQRWPPRPEAPGL